MGEERRARLFPSPLLTPHTLLLTVSWGLATGCDLLVTLSTLLRSTILGFVPSEEAFLGFGHPTIVTVAAVLIISRGLVKREWWESHALYQGRHVLFSVLPYRRLILPGVE